MEKEKSVGEKLSEKLNYRTGPSWEKLSTDEKNKTLSYCEEYKKFLNTAKTERRAAKEIVRLATEKGFKSFDDVRTGSSLVPGDKVYFLNNEKSVVLAVIGKQSPEKGFSLIASHIDSPRLDLKPNPLYEDTGIAYFKTHYYGGIKKFQWTTIPLELHGVVIKKNGEKVSIDLGDKDEDPVLYISDILIHLSKEQMEKKMSEGITGEMLNPILGSIPYDDDNVKDKIKLNILNYLYEKYDIVEEDLLSAELEIVPAYKSRDIGFDRSMIGSYGQDDRVCAYTSMSALLDVVNPENTCIGIFADKEEIGSMGNTGMESRFYINAIAEIINLINGSYSDLVLRRVLKNSRVLSADVNAGYDPNFSNVFEKNNSSFIGKGVVLTKYTGSRGKGGSNDANAEYVGRIRKIFNDSGVTWQIGELGKVDEGGGGTVALYMANYGMQVVDCGVALLSMHSPFELASKFDVYDTYKAFKAFYTFA